MTDAREEGLHEFFHRSREAFERAAVDQKFLASVLAIADRISEAFLLGGKLMLAGNGGSAADAQHIAAEFLSRFKLDRAPLPAIALTTDTSALTAIGNDYGFENLFERQVRGLGKKGDVFIGISTSGKSPNVLSALKVARDIGVTTIGFTGSADTPMVPLCDLVLAAPSDETALIQQIHITAAHAICGIVEREMVKVSAQS